MSKQINQGNYAQKSLNDCNEKSPVQEKISEDKIPQLCQPMVNNYWLLWFGLSRQGI